MRHWILRLILTFIIPLVSLEAATKNKYKYEIAACLMFYNEEYFLKEWLEYHKLVGIEHFYLFDNGSTDNYLEILGPYIEEGVVELYHYPKRGINQAEHNHIQCEIIYETAIGIAKKEAKWLAIIDADEFIYPVDEMTLTPILKDYEDFGGLYVDYLYFGTSHLDCVPEGSLILESLVFSSETAVTHGKSIVRPKRVKECTDPHRMWYKSPYYHVDADYHTFNWTPPAVSDSRILIFHYAVGDINHAMNVTFPRRKRWKGVKEETYLDLYEHSNARYNPAMEKFIPALREAIFR